MHCETQNINELTKPPALVCNQDEELPTHVVFL